MKDIELKELSENLKDGVPFATPVFDGANEHQIKELLKMLDCLKAANSIYMMDEQVKNLIGQLLLVICTC